MNLKKLEAILVTKRLLPKRPCPRAVLVRKAQQMGSQHIGRTVQRHEAEAAVDALALKGEITFAQRGES